MSDSLFDASGEPAHPYQKHSPTSAAAAQAVVAGVAARQRARVLAFIVAAADGATDAEIQRGLAMSGNTQRPRRRELETAGKVRDSGRTRKTQSGRSAVVWIVAI